MQHFLQENAKPLFTYVLMEIYLQWSKWLCPMCIFWCIQSFFIYSIHFICISSSFYAKLRHFLSSMGWCVWSSFINIQKSFQVFFSRKNFLWISKVLLCNRFFPYPAAPVCHKISNNWYFCNSWAMDFGFFFHLIQ